MSYTVLIGFNQVLAKGETWKENAGKVISFPDGKEEVRFEPGEVVAQLPKRTDLKALFEIGAVELVQEELGDG